MDTAKVTEFSLQNPTFVVMLEHLVMRKSQKEIKKYKQGISLLNAVRSKRKFPKSFKLRPVLM